MADSLCLKIQSPPDRLRPRALPGVSREPQPMLAGVGVNLAKQLRRRPAFVSADAKAHHVAILMFDCQFRHVLSLDGTKLPHRIENPQQRDLELLLAAL